MKTKVMNKICTSLEQSKKLIELGIDVNTADMRYSPLYPDIPWVWVSKPLIEKDAIPAWSLSALLKLMPIIDENSYQLIGTLDGGVICKHPCTCVMSQEQDPIDAVFEMICWLKEDGKL